MVLTRTLTAVLSVTVCLGVANLAGAEERLTLADATARALAKNPSIRVKREQVVAADARARGSLGVGST